MKGTQEATAVAQIKTGFSFIQLLDIVMAGQKTQELLEKYLVTKTASEKHGNSQKLQELRECVDYAKKKLNAKNGNVGIDEQMTKKLRNSTLFFTKRGILPKDPKDGNWATAEFEEGSI